MATRVKTKAKVLLGGTIAGLENKVNEWLEDKQNVDIISSSISQRVVTFEDKNVVEGYATLIIYKEGI